MKLKLDENFSPALASELLATGHDAETVLGEGLGGHDDAAVYAAARAEGRVLVTLDLDFANPLRFGVSGGPGIMVLRPPRPTFGLIRSLLRDAMRLADSGSRISGRRWIVEPGRVRIAGAEDE